MFRAIGRFWRAYVRAETLSGLWTWQVTQSIIAVGATAITVISGFAEGLPFTFIWVGAVVTAVATISGLIRFREWRKTASPRGLLFASNVVIEMDDSVVSGNALLNWVKLGVALSNLSDKPIYYRVTEMRSVISNRTHNNEPRAHNGGEVPPYYTSGYVDNAVPFNCLWPMFPN